MSQLNAIIGICGGQALAISLTRYWFDDGLNLSKIPALVLWPKPKS